MKIENERLAKLVKESELVSQEELDKGLKEAEEQHITLYNYLIENNLVPDDILGKLISAELGIPFVSLKVIDIDKKVLNIIPEEFAREQRAIAFKETDADIHVATSRPEEVNVANLIAKKARKGAQIYFSTDHDIGETILKYRAGIKKEFDQLLKTQAVAAKGAKPEDRPIIEMLSTIIKYAYHNKASDIHFDPYEEEVVVRFRMDGVLHDILSLPKSFLSPIVTRVKVLSKLRIDEHRAAQDGRMVQKLPEEKLDIRVSIIPTVHKEKAVLRLLASKAQHLTLSKLGFSKESKEKVIRGYKHPWGMILATGPTGCGKTTTLYSILQRLNKRTVNISTIEDPVEYDISGINQIQVNPKTNLSFAKGLRALLRQDPDIIMVGEIRDEETAAIAINSSMTGHLVLSTMHTNDAATAPVRLQEMQVEPYLVASTVNLIIAQRLVRKICEQCRESYTLTAQQSQEIGTVITLQKNFGKESIEGTTLYKGKGCKTCNFTGYKGRTGLFEILEISEDIRKMIITKSNTHEINEQALKEGMIPMVKDGVNKVLLGLTSIEEILRVTKES